MKKKLSQREIKSLMPVLGSLIEYFSHSLTIYNVGVFLIIILVSFYIYLN